VRVAHIRQPVRPSHGQDRERALRSSHDVSGVICASSLCLQLLRMPLMIPLGTSMHVVCCGWIAMGQPCG
jgi:hypothetical protein